MPGQCSHVLDNGERCKMPALKNEPFCFAHSPNRSEERATAKAKGGKNRCKPAVVLAADAPENPLTTAAEATASLGRLYVYILKGTVDVKIGSGAGYVAGLFLKALDAGELTERLRVIEEHLGISKKVAP